MNTTNLFVELIVIGVGVSFWLLLVACSVFGSSWLPDNDGVILVAAIPSLAVVYALGIIWDRISDWIFQKFWTDDLRSRHFDSLGEYYNARRTLLTQSGALSELLEYGRSRLRICRGWTLNALMSAIALNIFTWSDHSPVFEIDRTRLSIFGSVFLILLAGGSWFAWRSLAASEYRKISEQSAWLESRNSTHGISGTVYETRAGSEAGRGVA